MTFKKVIFLIGILIFLYPTISDWWNSYHQSQVISRYQEQTERLEKEEYESYWKDALEYNQQLGQAEFYLSGTGKERQSYESLLNMYQDGLMGYLEIPSIDCSLPIYHGTEEAVLQMGAGHMEGTSLPVGGENSHCVLSGHRGLPSARLFSNLDQLEEGEVFKLCILNEVLYYRVYQIQVVLPEDTDMLSIEEQEDLCTLVTCTPYGINTHRLLVRGRRIAAEEGMGEIEQMKQDSKEMAKGGIEMKDLLKWTVLCLLMIVFWFSSARDTHAMGSYIRGTQEGSQTDGSASQKAELSCNIKIEYPYDDVEFELYQINEEGNEIFLERKRTKEGGILLFENIKTGQYIIVGMEHEWEGERYQPVSGHFFISKEDAGNGQIIMKPKYEKLPSKDSEEPKTEEPQEESLPDGNTDSKLPQTGQMWLPAAFLLIAGGIFLLLGWIRAKR